VNTHWLFCGDTLFAGGCGRLLGGTPEQMYESLQKLKQLPEDTLVFCAHEYTVNNLLFEKSYAPNCLSIQERLHQAQHLRAQNLPTIPSTIGQEKQTNLFLLASNTEAFKAIRTAKDHF
jgi:hydroxyacylglutathione hydrolase